MSMREFVISDFSAERCQRLEKKLNELFYGLFMSPHIPDGLSVVVPENHCDMARLEGFMRGFSYATGCPVVANQLDVSPSVNVTCTGGGQSQF